MGGGWITRLWKTKWWRKCLACDTCHYASRKWWFLWRSESIVSSNDFSKLRMLNRLYFSQDTPPRSSAPTPTIVRPGSLPLHLGFDALQPTMPSPTSVITQAPPSNRTSLGCVLTSSHSANSSVSISEILPAWHNIYMLCLCSSPTSHYPMMMLPTGPALSVLPGPVHIPSVINVRHTL